MDKFTAKSFEKKKFSLKIEERIDNT